MCHIEFDSVEDMFRWKLEQEDLNKYSLEKIKYKSVEKENKEYAKMLGWPQELDVLYSFLLVYKLGLIMTNNDRFDKMKNEIKEEWNVKSINTNSTKFLFRCSQDKAYKKFNSNEHIKKFLKLYFSIGNVIPIWPGGNEARGKCGLYDIPELFFDKHIIWTKVLIQNYETAFLNEVINGTHFKFEEKEKQDINNFLLRIKEDNNVYFNYLESRNTIIIEREKKLRTYIDKIRQNDIIN